MEDDTQQPPHDIIYNGILDKIQILKDLPQQSITSNTLTIIKTSNDVDIQKLSSLIMGCNYMGNYYPNNIGLRRVTKIIQKDTMNIKLDIFEYNFLLSKKFTYLKDEAISMSDILLIIINIFDKKCFDNLKILIDNINNLINKSNNNYQPQLRFVLVKSTNNFLLKITESLSLTNAKNEINSIIAQIPKANAKFVEVDIDEIKETNNLINVLIN
jgi:hypothetical protein